MTEQELQARLEEYGRKLEICMDQIKEMVETGIIQTENLQAAQARLEAELRGEP